MQLTNRRAPYASPAHHSITAAFASPRYEKRRGSGAPDAGYRRDSGMRPASESAITGVHVSRPCQSDTSTSPRCGRVHCIHSEPCGIASQLP